MHQDSSLEAFTQSTYARIRQRIEDGECDAALIAGSIDAEADRLAETMQIPGAALKIDDWKAAAKIQEQFPEAVLNQSYSRGQGVAKKDAAVISIPIVADPRTVTLVLAGITYGYFPHPEVSGQTLQFALPIEGLPAHMVKRTLSHALADIRETFDSEMRRVGQFNTGALAFVTQLLHARLERINANKATVDWLNSPAE